MLTIGINLSDIVLTYGIIKKSFCVILVIIQINIVDMKFNSIMNNWENKM